MPSSSVLIPRICEYCDKPFMARSVNTRFCSTICNNKSLRERKKREKEEQRQISLLDTKKNKIADIQTRPYISVSEAAQLIGVSKSTIRRMLCRGMLAGANLGIRLTRIDRTQLEQLFTSIIVQEEQIKPKFYELDKCYTIGECLKKYNIPECRLESIIRAFNIPKRKVGNYVYIPRIEIDRVLNKIDGNMENA